MRTHLFVFGCLIIATPLFASAATALVPSASFVSSTPFESELSLGDRATVSVPKLFARAEPSISGKKYGAQQEGMAGYLKDGPVQRDGHVWWFVDYDNGPDGWSAEEYLSAVPIASSTNAQVVALHAQLQELLLQLSKLQNRSQ